jgi:small subunit ribosomal protein S20
LRNRAVKSALRSLIKKLQTSLTAKDSEGAKAMLVPVIKALNKAASKGVIHKNTASRRISRLTRKVRSELITPN